MLTSPLARGRGLKRNYLNGGAKSVKSPLARGRGLKPNGDGTFKFVPWSPLARGRGLKRGTSVRLVQNAKVAPRAGAWIETTLTKPP